MKRGQYQGADRQEREEGERQGKERGRVPDGKGPEGLSFEHAIQLLGPPILGVLIALLGSAGCYDTPRPDCGFTCGANAACPDDYICGSNNRCRLPSVPEEKCPAVQPAPDAGVDAPPLDAAVCVDLAPVSDGSDRQQLLLSEISPAVFIELFNPSSTDLTLDQGDWGLQVRGVTLYLKDLATTVTVPAHGYAHFPWPAALMAGNAGGELALYSGVTAAADFDDRTKLVGYACWGADPELARKQLAEDAGKWSGDCAAALAMAALRRKVASKGIAAADFSADVPAERTSCEP